MTISSKAAGAGESVPQQAVPDAQIGDYAVIGNLHTAALISRFGSLDFLSWPRFDSTTAFAALLDRKRGGRWTICLVDAILQASPPPGLELDWRYDQYYEPGTAVLVTRMASAKGVLELVDFMPPSEDVHHCQLVRCARCVSGEVEVHHHFEARYLYGAEAVDVTAGSRAFKDALDRDRSEVLLELPLGPNPAVLLGWHSSTEHETSSTVWRERYTLSAGEERHYVLQSESCSLPAGELAGYAERLLEATRSYWCGWSSKLSYQGRYRKFVERSAITLKMCTSQRYGSSVAAVTFGLPELLGGSLNWDYRYTWIRDSAFTMYAMLRLGLSEEAEAFIKWIENRCQELSDPAKLSLMYRLDGTCDLEEHELDSLDGYRESSPVRVGNGAHGQRQLDIYGELIDTIYLYNMFGHEITYEFFTAIEGIVNHVSDTWSEPDHGIWEARDKRKQYTMSKVMAWVAIDRAIRIAEHRGFPCDKARWVDARDSIYKALYGEYFNDDVEAWTQFQGSDKADASLLMMPLVRFVTTSEPKWRATLSYIESELVHDGLALRYRNEGQPRGRGDGLQDFEGYFTMCSFWYIEVLAKDGRLTEAERLMAKMLSYANHVGLFAEEIAVDGRQLGNFPQAFTHLGLISAALQIEEQRRGGSSAGASAGPQG